MAEITDIDPRSVSKEGGKTIVIKGSGFKKATRVYIEDPNSRKIPVAKYTIDSDSQITAVSPKLDFTNYSYIYVEADGQPSTSPTYTTQGLSRAANRLMIETPLGGGLPGMW